MLISFHAPREGGDDPKQIFNMWFPEFQSTPPARGATLLNAYCPIDVIPISIHAPREGGDSYIFPPPCLYNKNFNPRPPRGGRLAVGRNPGQHQHISIHAPREGGDSHDRHQLLQRDDFNPRPPRGGRLSDSILVDHEEAFQSTPPARGATISKFS